MLNKKDMKETTTATVKSVLPSVNIQELPASYVVRLDMPGLEKEAMKVHVNERVLTISGTTPGHFAEQDARSLNDSVATEYHREFILADDVDIQSVDASYNLGVLTVTLKKKEQYLPKEISVQ